MGYDSSDFNISIFNIQDDWKNKCTENGDVTIFQCFVLFAEAANVTDDDTGADDGEGGGGADPPSYTPPPACQLGAEAGLEEAPKTCQVTLPWTDGCIIGGCHKLRVLLIFSNLIKLKVYKY